MKEEKLLELAAYAEDYSNHPISLSIKKAYGKKIDNSRISNVQEIAGHADIKMTMERYAHARREKVIQAGKIIGSVFAEM